MRRHAGLVAQDIGMAVWRFGHVTNSCRSAGSTVRHDAKLKGDSLSHSVTQATLRASELQERLLSTLAWLSGDWITSPTAAGVLAARSDTMPSCRMPRSVTQTYHAESA